jgi:hypothetical protein
MNLFCYFLKAQRIDSEIAADITEKELVSCGILLGDAKRLMRIFKRYAPQELLQQGPQQVTQQIIAHQVSQDVLPEILLERKIPDQYYVLTPPQSFEISEEVHEQRATTSTSQSIYNKVICC